ncbi:unnamed protein product [Rotaria sp. Silwood1]|nr:unnamed protein product [Rotaria sp. Silwood1]CAF4789773.1 unnamed protein product [Rotaria sp. Silwood1]
MYREDSLRKSAINYLTINMMKSSWTLAKDDLDKIEPDTLIPHLSGKNRYSKLLIHIRTAVDDSTLNNFILIEFRSLGGVGIYHELRVFRNTYGNFHRSRDESSTRNISRRNEDRQISTSLPTATVSSTNTNTRNVSSKLASVRSSLLYFQLYAARSPSLSVVDEMALATNSNLMSTSLFPFYHIFS